MVVTRPRQWSNLAEHHCLPGVLVRTWPFLAAVAGFVTLAGVLGPADLASAAAPAKTVIGLSPCGGQVTYATRQISLTGQLSSDTDGQQHGLAGQQVTLTLWFDNDLGSLELGSATTGTDGDFSLPVTLPVPGAVFAQFAGNSTDAASTSHVCVFHRDPQTLASTDMPARILLNPISPVPAYSNATVTGQVQMQLPDGTWIPAPYTPISIAGSGDPTRPYTDANGDFAASLYVGSGGIEQQVQTSDTYGYAWSGGASTPPMVVPLSVFATQEIGFTALSSSLPDMTFTAYLEYANSQGVWQGLSAAHVQLYYQPLHSSQWILMGTSTSSFGRVNVRHVSGFLPGGKLATGTGVWQLRAVASSTYLASVSDLSVSVTVPVWVNHTAIKRSAGRSYLTGVLDDRRHGGPVAGQNVMLYRRGHRVATTRTNSDGEFSFAMSGRPSGVYEVRYSGGRLAAGGGRYVPATRSISVTYRE
jgi:hypothetical protein